MPNKPIIVHLARLYAPHLGGVEKHLFELTSIQNFSSYIITEQFDSSLPLLEKGAEATVIRLPMGSCYKLDIWKGIFSSFSLLKRADIIHVHDVFWWLLPFLPFLNRKKIYITFHGYEGNNAPNSNQIFWHRLAAWYTQGNISIGDFHKKWYKISPTYVSYGAVRKIKTPPEKKETKNKIIFVGRLSEDTGIFDYILAMRELYKKNKRIHLDIFGNGPLQRKVSDFIAKNHLPITMFGWVKPETIPWQNYELAFVSRYLSILEAMQYHLPIISHANNDIKYDYLARTPFASWIDIVRSPTEIVASYIKNKKMPPEAFEWVEKQTWNALNLLYIQLWLQSATLSSRIRQHFIDAV